MELMHELRRTRPNFRVVLITAFDDPAARREAAGAGVVTLQKPFDESVLMDAINGKLQPG